MIESLSFKSFFKDSIYVFCISTFSASPADFSCSYATFALSWVNSAINCASPNTIVGISVKRHGSEISRNLRRFLTEQSEKVEV